MCTIVSELLQILESQMFDHHIAGYDTLDW